MLLNCIIVSKEKTHDINKNVRNFIILRIYFLGIVWLVIRHHLFQHDFMAADVVNLNRQKGGYGVKRVIEFCGMKGAANPQTA